MTGAATCPVEEELVHLPVVAGFHQGRWRRPQQVQEAEIPAEDHVRDLVLLEQCDHAAGREHVHTMLRVRDSSFSFREKRDRQNGILPLLAQLLMKANGVFAIAQKKGRSLFHRLLAPFAGKDARLADSGTAYATYGLMIDLRDAPEPHWL